MLTTPTLVLILTAFSNVAFGAVGPQASFHIGNAIISPDGFSRSCAIFYYYLFIYLLTRNRAVVVNGQSPGPLLSGNKVSCDAQVWSAGLTGISGRQLQNQGSKHFE